MLTLMPTFESGTAHPSNVSAIKNLLLSYSSFFLRIRFVIFP